MKYPKIETLFRRQYSLEQCKSLKIRKNPILIDSLAKDEFIFIDKWIIQEKIHGMNIRILDTGEVRGRTDNASIPPKLLRNLNAIFTKEKLKDVFGEKKFILFGEGYGNKIETHGSYYLDHQSFILFDAYIDGLWANSSAIPSIANSLGIKSVPIFQRTEYDDNVSNTMYWTKNEIINFVKSKPKSLCSIKEQQIEGIVAKPYPILLFQNGDPVYFKLKCKDFE